MALPTGQAADDRNATSLLDKICIAKGAVEGFETLRSDRRREAGFQIEPALTLPLPLTEESIVKILKDNVVLGMLRTEFRTAITSERNALTLNPAIAELKEKISQLAFVETLSIYSRSQFRRMGDCLDHISTDRLRDDPLQVAGAVESVLQLFDDLDFSMKQTAAGRARIEARR